MKQTIASMAINSTTGLVVLFACMLARLYQFDEKLIAIGITNNKPTGSPMYNCRNVVFLLSRFFSHHSMNC